LLNLSKVPNAGEKQAMSETNTVDAFQLGENTGEETAEVHAAPRR
jgi:hypothetical protein